MNYAVPVIFSATLVYAIYKLIKKGFVEMEKKEPKKSKKILEIVKISDNVYKEYYENCLRNFYVPLEAATETDFKEPSDEPVYIRFRIGSKYYSMYAVGPLIKIEDCIVDVTKMITDALLYDKETVHDVTSEIQELQGPDYNFYKNIEGSFRDFSDILPEFNKITIKTILDEIEITPDNVHDLLKYF